MLSWRQADSQVSLWGEIGAYALTTFGAWLTGACSSAAGLPLNYDAKSAAYTRLQHSRRSTLVIICAFLPFAVSLGAPERIGGGVSLVGW